MADHKEVRYERLYVRVPGTAKLRKSATGRLRHYLNTRWREIERAQTPDYIRVRLERTGFASPFVKIKEAPAIAPPPTLDTPSCLSLAMSLARALC